MTSKKLSDELCAFVVSHVDSIAHLEALLLLFRNQGAALEVSAIADRLYVDVQAADDILARLVAMGLATRAGTRYRYSMDPALDRLIHKLARHHAEDLISITSLIHAR